ncbi:MAG: molecular chaperone Hsp90 [Eubacterium sp.]|nr:molecular chaperone Hsp90 [Eubacterium sp.]
MTTKAMAQAVLDAPSACPEFKETAQNYINAIGTDAEKDAATALVAEAKEDISPIDGTIAFFATDMAKDIFGADVAAQKLAHAKEIREQGAIYCDCPGCTAALEIINNENMF